MSQTKKAGGGRGAAGVAGDGSGPPPVPDAQQPPTPARRGSLLAIEYPTRDEWVQLLDTFDAKAIAHKLLLAHVPYVFRHEPLKFALFKRTIADAFDIEPTCVFIVGSAMAGRSLKGRVIDQEYSTSSDIDVLIVSEPLFTSYVMRSLEWLRTVTSGERKPGGGYTEPKLSAETTAHIRKLAANAAIGIWRPDSLPREAEVRNRFFDRFSDVSLKTLGLQLSDDTVAKVNGRVARSLNVAIDNLASSLRRLKRELSEEAAATEDDEDEVPGI